MANDSIGNLIQSPSLGGSSSYDVYLPIRLQGALAGLSSEPILVSNSFNSDTDTFALPSGATIKGFFDSIAANLKTEGVDALSSLRGVSLDGLLDGLSTVLDGWAKPDGQAFQKLPVVNKSVVEVLGKGKVNELAMLVEHNDADVVIFDNDLSPAQIRNLEKVLKTKVLDRSEVILDIFAARAQTYEARLAVELAQLEYSLPRLKQMIEARSPCSHPSCIPQLSAAGEEDG
jgi:hypothetical protein